MTENSVSVSPRADWLYELKKSYTRPEDLLSALQLRVPRPFVQQMNIGDPNDPLLRQVLPLVDEFRVEPGFHKDPLDEQSSPANGLLHKYHGRVLLILQGGCAVNCRYCFRRHFPYDELTISQRQIDDTLDYIKQNPEVNEVILSGGDPLMAKDERLHKLVRELEALPQLTRLRIHSRLPVVIPSRLTDGLLTSLTQSRLQVVLVIHANHANEISNDLSAALKKWHNAGIHLLNQSVLLRGVNDSSEVLCRLSETLFRANVLPYYLHQLDKVEGASHFEVSDDKAQQLWLDMTQQLPGFLVPKLVREQARKPSKTAIMPDGLTT